MIFNESTVPIETLLIKKPSVKQSFTMYTNTLMIDEREYEDGIDEAMIMEFDIFKMQDLMISKDERIETLELEIKQLRAKVALLDGRLGRISDRARKRSK